MKPQRIAVSCVAFLAVTGWLVCAGHTHTVAPANVRAARASDHVEPAAAFSETGKAALSGQLNAAVTRGDTPAVVALVVAPNAVLYEGAAGKFDVAHDTAMPVNAIFSIASVTKPITSVAIMILFEEGKLKLDDPVSKYLPGFDTCKS